MKQSLVAFLLCMTIVIPAFAGEDRIDLASINRNDNLRMKNIVLPPRVTEKYEYYEITGKGEKELQCQMKQKGCEWNDGHRYASVTTWNWRCDYGYERAPQSCTADSFRTTVEIIYRYPQWVRPNDAPRKLVDKWEDYLKHLIEHEQGHRDMAVAAAAELSRTVSELPPASSCAELDREVQSLRRERMEKLNTAQRAYDAATVHGSTQGAVFP